MVVESFPASMRGPEVLRQILVNELKPKAARSKHNALASKGHICSHIERMGPRRQ